MKLTMWRVVVVLNTHTKFRENRPFHHPYPEERRVWRVYLATGFDFREKNRAGLGSIGDSTLLPASHHVSLLGTDDERVDFPETSYVY